jgi:hypothetical protein
MERKAFGERMKLYVGITGTPAASSFDPAYATPPLEHYEPMLRSFFSRRSS